MISKTRAIETFLSGLIYQLPPTALTLLENDDKLAINLLQKSIEALPMGSPIRKLVDENLDECIKLLRTEVEKLLEAVQSESVAATSVNDLEKEHFEVLPVVNEKTYCIMLENAKNANNTDLIQVLKATDHATQELFFNDDQATSTLENLLTQYQALLISRQTQASDLNYFVRKFTEILKAGDVVESDLCERMASVRKITTSILGGALETLDIMTADDLGQLVGFLTAFSILHPEEYLQIRKSSSQNSSDSEDEIDERRKKRRKIARSVLEEEARMDNKLLLSLILSSISYTKQAQSITAGFVIGFIRVILLQEQDHCSIFASSPLSENMKQRLSRVGSSSLIQSMELGNVISGRDLPCTSLVKDGKKRCQLINKWAKKQIMTVAKESMEVAQEPESNESAEEKSNVLFLVDRDPTRNRSDEEENNSGSDEVKLGERNQRDGGDNDCSFVGTDADVSEEKDQSKKNTESPACCHDDEKEETDQLESEEYTFTVTDADGSERDDQSPLKAIAPIETKKGRKRAAPAVLPPVPEDQEAVDVIDKNPQAPAPTPIEKTPSRSTKPRSDSISSVGTPSRMTRSRARRLSESSVESIESVTSFSTPAKKRPTMKTSSDISDTEGTPLRRSARKRKSKKLS